MRILHLAICGLMSFAFFSTPTRAEDQASAEPLVLVVMDPLAKPLSCPCVAGYAQRDYELLGTALGKSLRREVRVVFNESLAAAIRKESLKSVDIVIGKQSVILHDAKAAQIPLKKVAALSGKDGLTTQRGLFVVASGDPAKSIADLKGYSIYFGPQECDEKHAAAIRLLKKNDVVIPTKLETAVACDEGAIKILEMAAKGERGCAVISSYAKPLLEGCGQVPKGSLKIVGETEEVPFVTAFVNSSRDEAVVRSLTEALLKSTSADVKLRIGLETRTGFVASDDAEEDLAKKK